MILFCLVLLLLVNAFVPKAVFADQIGINLLESDVVSQIDNRVSQTISHFNYINIGLVADSKVVFTKAYGNNNINSSYEYASVSKPVTAMLIMSLVKDGSIASVDDSIWKYISKVNGQCDHQNPNYTSVTIRHLLTHKSGLGHNDSPVCSGSQLNLLSEPGTTCLYSTPGYGVLGEVIQAVTGKSYGEAVASYVGMPVGASSMSANSDFIAPGAYVKSTIKDMARFTIGVMDYTYVPQNVFYNTMLENYCFSNSGFAWWVSSSGDNIMVYHSGSNGSPRSYLRIKPRKKISASALGYANTSSRYLGGLTLDLINILESSLPPSSPSSTISPTSTPTTTTSVLGDINADGLLNSGDIVALLGLWDTNQQIADLNNDGRISALDFSSLLLLLP